jgi:hypothetical protein
MPLAASCDDRRMPSVDQQTGTWIDDKSRRRLSEPSGTCVNPQNRYTRWDRPEKRVAATDSSTRVRCSMRYTE